MPLNRFLEQQVKTPHATLQVGLLILRTGVIVLVSDADLALGSIAISTPSIFPSSTPYSLVPIIGMKNQSITRLIGEHVTQRYGITALAIVHLKNEDFSIVKSAITTIDKMIESNKVQNPALGGPVSETDIGH